MHPWECDSVGHFTTAFYYKAFSAAAADLLQRMGLGPKEMAGLKPVTGRTRFRRELLAGDAYHVDSGVVSASADTLVLGDRLYNSEDGGLCVLNETAYRGVAGAPGEALAIDWSQEDSPGRIDAAAMSRWTRTAGSLVRDGDLDLAGRLDFCPLIHAASDANVQFQNIVGMTSSYMREHDVGYSTVEYQIDFGALPTRIGTMIETHSAMAKIGRTSLWFVHRLTEALSGAHVATVAQFGVHLDRGARRPSEVPDRIRAEAGPFLPG